MAAPTPTDRQAKADRAHMGAALALARRGLGRVAPNPAVGCVLADDAGRVLARGWTQPGGRPHAETEALGRAGATAKGATAYVSLEPCVHHGATPPCAEALAEAGIARCVVALEDPDERVSGKGLEFLRRAGVAVEVGLLAEAAAEVNAGFLLHRRAGRPLVTLKLATSLDGRIATAKGESRWITGEAARARVHLLRASHDAVLVGGGTAFLDDPRLDVRLPGLEDRVPLRVVLDGRLRLPLTHDLVVRAKSQPTCLITRPGNEPARLAAYGDAGVRLVEVSADGEGRPDLLQALQALGKLGITRLLVEGGSDVAAGLLLAGLADRLVCFRSGRVIGGDGVPAVAGFGLEVLDRAPGFERVSTLTVGPDLVETYRRLA